MNWKLLGIEETKDKKAIKQAYRNKLSEVNPEDKPEEFMELRAVYEEALRFADTLTEDNVPQTDIDIWRDKLQALYDDFPKRLNQNYWRELLSEDVCIALDTRPQIEEALLRFLMDTYRIPQSVWQYLDGEFSFSTRVKELYENYPRDFIDYVVINGIKYPEYPLLSLFSPGKDGDEIEKFIKLFRQIRNMPPEEARDHYDELLSLSEQHPYARSYMLLVDIDEGDKSRIEELRALAAEYPNDNVIVYDLASRLYSAEDYKGAEENARIIYNRSGTYGSGVLIARSLAAQKLYKEACDLVDEIADGCRGNQDKLFELGELVKEWNEVLIDQYRKKLEKEPDDYDTRYELYTCLNTLDRMDEAHVEMEKFPEGKPDEYAYYNMHARVYFAEGKFEAALECIEKQMETAKKLVPDGTRRTQGRIEYADTLNYVKGLCLLNLGNEEEANRIFEDCLEKMPGDAQLLTNITGLRISKHQDALAAETAEKLVELQPDSAYAHGLLAHVMYNLYRDRDALDSIDRSIAINPSDLYAYLLKLRLLARNNIEDEFNELIEILASNDITDLPVINWCKAQIKAANENLENEALADYDAIYEQIKDEEKDKSWMPEFYYMYARLVAVVSDKSNNSDDDAAASRRRIIEILNKGLECDPEDPDCMDYKAWLLKRDGNYRESIELYKKLEKYPERKKECAENLAELYYDDLESNADKAYEYYNYLLKQNEEDATLCFYVGMCLFYMGAIDEAAEMFWRESVVDPDDVDGYYRLSMVRAAQGRTDEALELADKAIDIVRNWETNKGRFYRHKINLLRRLGRFDDAVETVREAEKAAEINPYPQMVDIYEQKGDFEAVGDCLKHWHKQFKKDCRRNAGHAIDAKVLEERLKYDYLRGNDISAFFRFCDWPPYSFAENRENALVLLHRMRAASGSLPSAKILIRLYRQKVKKLDPDKDKDEYIREMKRYICALYLYGSQAKAQELAKNLVKVSEKYANDYTIDRLLWHTRWINSLVQAGCIDRAREELELIDGMPLCSMCHDESCICANEIRVLMEIHSGNYEKALELVNNYRRNSPDDIELVEYRKWLERKVKK